MNVVNDGHVLVVRHGEGRGRIPDYGRHMLDRLRTTNPGLSSRLSVHGTGQAPVDVAGARAVVFWLADPLELYPACLDEASRIAERAHGLGLPIVNPPAALAGFSKSKQLKAWREAGIPTPAGEPFASPVELGIIAHRSSYPILIRGDTQHGETGRYCARVSEVLPLPGSAGAFPGIVSEFVDVRSAWRRSRPTTVWARFHHRRRVYVVGDEVVPGTLYFSRDPVVSRSSSTLQDYRERARRIRERTPSGKRRALQLALARLGTEHRRCLRAERRFLAASADSPELMVRAAQVLGLGFAAIDYSLFPDGTPMLWELNPYPFIPGARQTPFPELRGIPQALERLYGAVEKLFEKLISGPRQEA